MCTVPCRKGPVSSESQENKNEDQFRLLISAKQVASMELVVERKTGITDAKT